MPLLLLCVRADGNLGGASYVAILTPLWILDALVLAVHLKSVSLPTQEPPEDDDGTWRDPFPRSERAMAALSFLSFVCFEVLGAAKADGSDVPMAAVAAPYWVWECFRLKATLAASRVRVASVEDLEEEKVREGEEENEGCIAMTPARVS